MSKKTKMAWNVSLIVALLVLLFILEQIMPSGSMLFTVLKKGGSSVHESVKWIYGIIFSGAGGFYALRGIYLCDSDDSPRIESQRLSVL